MSSSTPDPLDFTHLMQEATKMRTRMQEAQKQLKVMTVTGTAGTGDHTVTVEMNGQHEVRALRIAPSVFKEEHDMISALVVTAINNAVRQVEEASQKTIHQFTAGLNIPNAFLSDEQS